MRFCNKDIVIQPERESFVEISPDLPLHDLRRQYIIVHPHAPSNLEEATAED